MDIFLLFVGGIFVNNFVLSRFLGICPVLGVSKKTETALGMGLAVTFVMTIAGAATFLTNYALAALEIEYLSTIAFIIIIASLVQAVEMFLKKASPSLYKALGLYLPLITSNCAVFAVTLINIASGFNFLEAVLFSFASAIGFTLAIVLLAGIRERMSMDDIPKSAQGFPITLITTGLMAIAFLGFTGLIN